MSAAERAYRLLLRVYPREFRAACGPESVARGLGHRAAPPRAGIGGAALPCR